MFKTARWEHPTMDKHGIFQQTFLDYQGTTSQTQTRFCAVFSDNNPSNKHLTGIVFLHLLGRFSAVILCKRMGQGQRMPEAYHQTIQTQ